MNRAVIIAAALAAFSGQQALADPLNSGIGNGLGTSCSRTRRRCSTIGLS